VNWFSRRLPPGAPLAPPPRVYLHYPATFLQGEKGQQALADAGCVVVDRIEDADWVLMANARNLHRLLGRVAHILIYTHEPRYAIGRPQREVRGGTTIHTHDLSLGHFEDVWEFYILLDPQPHADPAAGKRAGTVLVARNQPDIAHAHPADLIGARAEIAEYGARRGLLDPYGKGWEPLPTRVEAPDPGGTKNWVALKHDSLGAYRYNIALESTYLPNYVSEKFWQAAQAGCLPVYLGSPWMDRLVDPSLYVDLRNHASPASLFAELRRIPEPDRVRRVRALQERLAELRELDAKARGGKG